MERKTIKSDTVGKHTEQCGSDIIGQMHTYTHSKAAVTAWARPVQAQVRYKLQCGERE